MELCTKAPLPCQMKRSAVGEDRSWHYRLVHHGIWDHDIPRPRIADHVIQSFLGDAARISFSLSEITASCAPLAAQVRTIRRCCGSDELVRESAPVEGHRSGCCLGAERLCRSGPLRARGVVVPFPRRNVCTPRLTRVKGLDVTCTAAFVAGSQGWRSKRPFSAAPRHSSLS